MKKKLANLPEQKRLLLAQLVEQLGGTAGVSAVVLGGSYASGAYHEKSDIDIGLYYSPTAPFAVADIQRIAENAAAGGAVKVVGFYEWGAWVNGGAWIHTPYGKFDFLYRNLEQVQQTIAEAQAGITHHDYDQQPAYGFYSVIYLAETQICIPLYDPKLLIPQLKRMVDIYPAKLKQRIIAGSLWSAEFTLLHARGFAAQGDIYNTVGCLTRVVGNLTQALFALNERYFLRDKQVMDVIATFPNRPSDYIERINHILEKPGSTTHQLEQTVGDLEHLWRGVISLPSVHYEPQYQL